MPRSTRSTQFLPVIVALATLLAALGSVQQCAQGNASQPQPRFISAHRPAHLHATRELHHPFAGQECERDRVCAPAAHLPAPRRRSTVNGRMTLPELDCL